MKDFEDSLFDVLSEGIQTGIYVVNQEMKITYCNTWFERFTGLSREYLIGSQVTERFQRAQADHLTSIYHEVFDAGTSYVLSPWLHPDVFIKDSESCSYLFIRLFPVVDDRGKTLGVITTISDLTEMNQFEHKLTERNTRLIMIIELTDLLNKSLELIQMIRESLSLVTRMTRLTGGVVYLINEQERTLNLVASKGIINIIPPKHLEFSNSIEALKSILSLKTHAVGSNIMHDFPFHKMAEAGNWENMAFVPLTAESRTLGIMLLGSSNSRKFDEDEISLLGNFGQQIGNAIQSARLVEELVALNKGKDKLFSIVSHDLKSPFQTILGFSDLLLNEYASMSEIDRISMIKRIHSSSQQASRLADDLLQWASLNSGKLVLTRTSFNFTKLVGDTISFVIPAAEQKLISIDILIEKDYQIYADFQAVRNVLYNLLVNAVKFTNRGGQIKINAIPQEKFLVVSVSDNGIGMPDEIKKKLFRVEAEVTRPGTAREKGTGLGLLLCHEIIEKNGGSIWVESEVDQGTTFYFKIPLTTKG